MNSVEERLANYREVLDAVEPAGLNVGVVAPSVSRRPLAIAASLLLVVGLTGIATLVVNRPSSDPTPASIASPEPASVSSPGIAPLTIPPPATSDPGNQMIGAVLAVGDSVMAGATSKLTSAGLTVDAQQNRQGAVAAELLESAAEQNTLGDAVVIQIGTNGPMSVETWDRIMVAVASVDNAVVLTVKADVVWIEGNNALIRALPGTYPNVIVVDWEAIATANPQYLYADHTHLKGIDGAAFYSNLILEALGRETIS
jgi:hypothetical protein